MASKIQRQEVQCALPVGVEFAHGAFAVLKCCMPLALGHVKLWMPNERRRKFLRLPTAHRWTAYGVPVPQSAGCRRSKDLQDILIVDAQRSRLAVRDIMWQLHADL